MTGRLPLVAGLAIALVAVVGLATGAQPAYAGSPGVCTWDASGCEAALQRVLGEELAPIEINANQLTIPSFDYVDPNSTTGADIFDYLEAQQAAGVAPDDTAIATAMDPAVGALDVGAAELAPETLGVSVIGAVVASYGLKFVWGTFGSTETTQQLGVVGENSGPRWIHYDNGCTNIAGSAYPSGIGGAYLLRWSSDYGYASGDEQPSPICGLWDPAPLAAYVGNGVPAQFYADDKAMWDELTAAANASSQPCTTPHFWDLGNLGFQKEGAWSGGTGTIDDDVYAFGYTDGEYGSALGCELTQIGPEPASPPATTTVTAPSPASVDFSAPRSFITGPALTTGINQALVDGGATVDPQGDNWSFNGSDTVTYGPYVVPQYDTYARVYCTDDNSPTGWTTVTPGQSVTLTRTGIGFLGSDGPQFQCYVDAAPDTSVDSPTQTADPNVNPNPDTFTEGTAVQEPPPDECGSNCDSGGLQPLDFTPITQIANTCNFPFGVLCIVKNAVGAFNASPVAPELNWTLPDISMGPLGTMSMGQHYDVKLTGFDTYMGWIRVMESFVLWFGAVWYVGSRLIGLKGGGDPSVAVDEAFDGFVA